MEVARLFFAVCCKRCDNVRVRHVFVLMHKYKLRAYARESKLFWSDDGCCYLSSLYTSLLYEISVVSHVETNGYLNTSANIGEKE